MDQALKDLWIEALLSGKYKQAEGVLRADYLASEPVKMCCMGVLADVVCPTAWVKRGLDKWVWDIGQASLDQGTLGRAVAEELKLSHPFMAKLEGMNDDGKTFEEIAAVIESGYVDGYDIDKGFTGGERIGTKTTFKNDLVVRTTQETHR